ncbi:MAG: insulinase family protein [Candidatus Brocadiae bacterium]|nr:insulinase family protein [Candidatus Brocadiia bacterium]
MKLFLPALLVALAALPLRAEDPGPVLTAEHLGIREYRMANGLRVLLYPDATAPKISVNLTVLVGSIHEGAGESGMAHVFEHVLFHSAEGFPDIAGQLRSLGANYNGSTWFERTNYFETFAASDINLETAISMEAARLGRAVLNEVDLKREGKIVESEFDMGASSPHRMVVMGMFGAMFDFHAYARSPIGTLEDFKALRIENVRSFYKRYYRPDNALLIVTGKFEIDPALALITKHFGGLQGTREGRPAYTTREPASMGERRFTIRKPGEAHVVLAAYRMPGAAHADSATADVFCRMLVSGTSGPLHEAVVAKGLAGSVEIETMPLQMASPLFVLATVPKAKDPEAVEAAILKVMETGAAALTEEDLARAKSLLERDFEELFNSAEALALGLSEAESSGSWKLLLVRREQTKAVTLADVQAFAAKYIRLENRVVGRFTPDDAAAAVLPEREPDLKTYEALLGKLPKSTKAVKEFDYTPAGIQAALGWSDVGPAKVGLLRKEVKGDRVQVEIFLPLAGREEIFPRLVAGEALASLMTERTKALEKGALKTRLAKLKSTIAVGVSLEGATISIGATKASLKEVMAIAGEMLRSPEIGEGALKDLVQRSRDRINAQRDEPMVAIQTAIPGLLFPDGDPRRGLTPDQRIAALEALTVESVMDFHRTFLGADGAVVGVVGDLSADEVKSLLSPLVTGWKAVKPGVLGSNAAVDKILQPLIVVETPGKPSAVSVMVQPLRLSASAPDYPAVEAAGWVLFMDMMSSRIPKKVRVEKALSYATGGMVVADPRGDFGMLILFTMTKPENAARALELIRTELAAALKDGVTPEELADFKTSYLNRVSQERADDSVLADAIVTLKVAGRDFGAWATMDAASAKLTVEDVNAAIRKYFDTGAMGLVQVGDFAGAGKKTEGKAGEDEEEEEDGE